MAEARGSGNWVIWVGLSALVIVIGLAEPLILVAAVCVAIGALFLAAGLRSRRPIKKQSFPIFPDEIEGRIWEAILPGSGNWYMRFACIGGAAFFFFLGFMAVADLFHRW